MTVPYGPLAGPTGTRDTCIGLNVGVFVGAGVGVGVGVGVVFGLGCPTLTTTGCCPDCWPDCCAAVEACAVGDEDGEAVAFVGALFVLDVGDVHPAIDSEATTTMNAISTAAFFIIYRLNEEPYR